MTQRVPWPFIGLLFVFWFIGTLRLSDPYYGLRDNLEIWIPAAVRNFERYGGQTIGYMVTTNPAPVDDPQDLTYYSHHPPLVVWLPALLTQLVSQHELGIRYVFVAATMITLSAFYVFARRAFDLRLAFWAVLLFALTPMTAYYLTGHNHDPLGFAVVMLFGAVFMNWWHVPTRLRTLTLTILIILAVWTAWPAVFMVAAICALVFHRGSISQRLTVIGWGGLAIVSFLSMMTYYEIVRPGSIESVLDAFVWRTSNASLYVGSESFTALDWLAKNSLDVLIFGSIGIIGLALIGMRSLWRRSSHRGRGIVVALLGGSLAYLMFFRNAAFIHVYYKSWLLPSMTLASAASVVWVRPYVRHTRGIIDGLILVTFSQLIIILVILLMSFHQPGLDATLDYMNTRVHPTTSVLISNENWEKRQGFGKVIAFYTGREFYLNKPLEDILALSDEPLVHIDCLKTQDESPEPIAVLADSCTVWLHDPAAAKTP